MLCTVQLPVLLLHCRNRETVFRVSLLIKKFYMKISSQIFTDAYVDSQERCIQCMMAFPVSSSYYSSFYTPSVLPLSFLLPTTLHIIRVAGGSI